MTDTLPIEPVYSTFGNDPDLSDLVVLFVEDIPERLESLRTHAEAGDWEQLKRDAHQMKGAAGSYGFDQVTPFAAALESKCRALEPEEEILASLGELLCLCQRLSAGGPM